MPDDLAPITDINDLRRRLATLPSGERQRIEKLWKQGAMADAIEAVEALAPKPVA